MNNNVTTPAWNGYDGIINDKPFMPGFSPARQAMTLMELAELDGERLGPEERELVVQYANAIKNYREVAGLVSELCECGYELQFGAPDPMMVSYIEREIARANARSAA